MNNDTIIYISKRKTKNEKSARMDMVFLSHIISNLEHVGNRKMLFYLIISDIHVLNIYIILQKNIKNVCVVFLINNAKEKLKEKKYH